MCTTKLNHDCIETAFKKFLWLLPWRQILLTEKQCQDKDLWRRESQMWPGHIDNTEVTRLPTTSAPFVKCIGMGSTDWETVPEIRFWGRRVRNKHQRLWEPGVAWPYRQHRSPAFWVENRWRDNPVCLTSPVSLLLICKHKDLMPFAPSNRIFSLWTRGGVILDWYSL